VWPRAKYLGNPDGVVSFSGHPGNERRVRQRRKCSPRGPDGIDGAPGSVITGAQVDSVASLNPTDPASATASYDGSIVHFSFGIPRGIDGTNGAPGEVSNVALDAAIGGTSSNSNGVGTPDMPFADPDDEALRGKVNELIAALRRL
jgi:hypothetical protein